jgi:hypothetical protein
MANRILTKEETKKLFEPLLRLVNNRLEKFSMKDKNLLWALRRRLALRLIYAERGTPMYRRRLKAQKREQQNNLCAVCLKKLPKTDVVLDRLKAMNGYTAKNTRVLCRDCDFKVQTKRRFK